MPIYFPVIRRGVLERKNNIIQKGNLGVKFHSSLLYV
jgi:hypothetical protein